MLKFLREQLTQLLNKREGLQAELDGIVEKIEAEQRNAPNDAESKRSGELLTELTDVDKQAAELRERIDQAEQAEERANREAEARRESGDVGEQRERSGTKVREPEVYRKHGRQSYFRDLVAVSLQRDGFRAAADRLERNSKQVADALEPEEARALSTTDGAGGDFVPPLWMVNDYVELARTARPTADRVRNQPLPTGTDSVNIPKILTGTAVAEQATQNTAVQNTDATTGSVTANVATLAGQQVIPVQLIEQSPLNMDEILLEDLAADYAAKVDLFVLTNNATNKWGLLSQAGVNAVTFTTGSPTAQLLWPKIADAIQQVTSNIFMPPDTIVMSPRRWAFLLAALDTAGRPLVTLTAGQNAQNSLGTSTGVASANGVVGNLAGLDVIVDPLIPTNLGAGTNEDRIIVMRASDQILWEGAPHAEAFRETKADQLSVLLRFYRYAAFTSGRRAKSVSVIAGTGLTPPTF